MTEKAMKDELWTKYIGYYVTSQNTKSEYLLCRIYEKMCENSEPGKIIEEVLNQMKPALKEVWALQNLPSVRYKPFLQESEYGYQAIYAEFRASYGKTPAEAMANFDKEWE